MNPVEGSILPRARSFHLLKALRRQEKEHSILQNFAIFAPLREATRLTVCHNIQGSAHIYLARISLPLVRNSFSANID